MYKDSFKHFDIQLGYTVWSLPLQSQQPTMDSRALIDGLQSNPWDSKDNDTAAMLVPHTIEVNETLL